MEATFTLAEVIAIIKQSTNRSMTNKTPYTAAGVVNEIVDDFRRAATEKDGTHVPDSARHAMRS